MTPATAAAPAIDKALLKRLAGTIRGLAIDGVEAANSGHPGLPLGCADIAAVLFYHHLRYNPSEPSWPDRDRFILSAGHGSMLLYATLHLAGYGLSLEELKNFRQLGSKTPGHPENFVTTGVETTTGPLGQGFGNGVGMALSAEMIAARFEGLFDLTIDAIVSDGDLMEGVASEAASFAGHNKLGRIVYVYDDNKISIEGHTSVSFSGEDVGKRFEAYGWHVLHIDGHDYDQINEALAAGKAETERPTLIVARTTIGFGSPNKADSHDVHGAPLGKEELKLTKENLGLPLIDFHVPEEDRAAWSKRAAEGEAACKAWHKKLDAAGPEVQRRLHAFLNKELQGDLKALRPSYPKPMATRSTAGMAQNAYAPAAPWLVGGSADLAPSTNTLFKGEASISAGHFAGRNLHWGVREHGMGAILNGMALHGFFKPFGATFFVFTDYMRPTMRLAALMQLPVVYIMTHDSIFLGEDGPTHQPVEHLAALRAIPGMTVIRPMDGAESAIAWEHALVAKGPVTLVLTRQNLPNHDRAAEGLAPADNLLRGAYTLVDAASGKPALVLVATGSEVALALDARKQLEAEGIATRVVSMPSWELFEAQDQAYRDSVLPPSVRKRLVVEAGIRMGWDQYATEDGGYVVMTRFGASAPAKDLAKKFGFTVENVVAKAKALLA